MCAFIQLAPQKWILQKEVGFFKSFARTVLQKLPGMCPEPYLVKIDANNNENFCIAMEAMSSDQWYQADMTAGMSHKEVGHAHSHSIISTDSSWCIACF